MKIKNRKKSENVNTIKILFESRGFQWEVTKGMAFFLKELEFIEFGEA